MSGGGSVPRALRRAWLRDVMGLSINTMQLEMANVGNRVIASLTWEEVDRRDKIFAVSSCSTKTIPMQTPPPNMIKKGSRVTETASKIRDALIMRIRLETGCFCVCGIVMCCSC